MMPLGPADWRRVRECFEDALTVPAETRERFVRDVCADPALAGRVLSLLAAHSRANRFLETPAAGLFDCATAPRDLTGAELGPYRILEQIGTGGMGDVYRARDSRLERDVAIKVLSSHTANDDASRRRFEREARAVAALNHPHICTLHDIGIADGTRYLVMEFLHGETLSDMVARGPLTPGATEQYAIQIASALSAAHRAGIVHRDLKPGNIMITPAGAKLLDFGVATAVVPRGTETPTYVSTPSGSGPPITTLLGTVSYMAPEQLRGDGADARSDVFAFGCVLYEMITARKVFDDRVSGLDARMLARSSLHPVVEKCLAEAPDDRWQTADDLVRELRHAVSARAHRQRRAVVAAGAAAVLLAVGGWAFLSRPPTSAPAAVSTQLAVLPLQTIGDTSGDEHLGVAIADTIITRLATVPGIRLRPTTAVLNYRHASNAPADAATALSVNHVLTGTIQRSPANYRISFQLVRGSDGAVTWGRTYDIVRNGLLDLPDRVAEQVAGALHLELGSGGDRRSRYTARADAYDEYLKGRAALLNYTEPGMKEAIAAFERAIAIDSEYALARAGLALASAWWSIRYAYESEARPWGARADTEARSALASDPMLAEARLAMAGAAGTLYGGFKWSAVIEDARRALEMDPTLELAHVVLMRAYFHVGLFDEMRAEAEKARQLNPLGNVEVARLEVAASLFSGRYAQARDQAGALLARSEAPTIRTYLGLARFYTGEVERARRTLAEGKPGTVAYARSQAALASVEAAAGEREAARDRAVEIGQGPYMDHHVAYSLGAAWAQLGDAGEAVTWLQRAADTGFPCFPFVQRDPLLDGIRQHPRFLTFQAALRRRFDRDSGLYATAR